MTGCERCGGAGEIGCGMWVPPVLHNDAPQPGYWTRSKPCPDCADRQLERELRGTLCEGPRTTPQLIDLLVSDTDQRKAGRIWSTLLRLEAEHEIIYKGSHIGWVLITT